jgi:uncharacterized protein YqjF (DUF2071 family)
MTQTWRDVLFAHWPVPVAHLRALVPPSLPIDSFNGEAWLSVTPLYIAPLRMRFLPPMPGNGAFPEINVRTYVTLEDKPGIYFFSLDARSLTAVLGARAAYLLPYFHARMQRRKQGETIAFRSERRTGVRAAFAGEYSPVGPVREAQRGTLDYFLVERYCLYTVGDRMVYRAEIHHPAWPLQDARAEISVNTMARAAGVDLPDKAPLVHYANHLKVLVWPLRTVAQRAYVRDARVAIRPI